MTIYESLAQKIKQHIVGEVRFDDMMRVLYSTDASHYQVYPIGVVLPKSMDDIAATVQLCAEYSVPIVPRGGGSGLCGQSIGPGVVIDTTQYMNHVLDIDAANHRVRVESGVILGPLNKQLAPLGLMFGPDPASAERAAVGGIIGTNATGAHSIKYGMTSDNIDAVRCVLADGQVTEFGVRGLQIDDLAQSPISNLQSLVFNLVKARDHAIHERFPKVWRRASGYNIDYLAEMLAYDPVNPSACLTDANIKRQTTNLENHLRQVSQFNLAPLICGSEGTLAMVGEATLHLVPKPKQTALIVAAFDSVIEAMRAVPLLVKTEPDAIELIGDTFIKLAADLPEYRDKLHWVDLSQGVPQAVLVMEFAGEEASGVRDQVSRAQALIESEKLPCRAVTLTDVKAQADVWAVRKGGLAILQSLRGEFKPISVVEDIAVPVEHLADFVSDLLDIFAEFGASGALYGHASAGCLHVRPLVNLKTVEGIEKVRGIGQRALELTLQYSGAMSGEHGDGYERTRYNEALFGPELYQAFCEIKDAFDPKHLLNPNKKVHGLDMEESMRFGPGYRTLPFGSTFSFQKDGSLAALAERCNGVGVCRKHDSGVMCPSYRVTLDETHSTRGRANLLQELLSNRGKWAEDSKQKVESRRQKTLGSSAHCSLLTAHNPRITEDHVLEALDLCISCKACASECASGVDMAKMKSDFVQHIYEQRGTPLRAWALGRIAMLSEFASYTPTIANWMLKQRGFKRMLGIAERRELPAFAKRTFMRWWGERGAWGVGRKATPHAQVVLFADTFTRYNHPEIGIAAVEVLEKLGYEVIIPEWQCCGRPLISQGQPKAARELAEFNVRTLAPYARQGLPILGLEPSCISALSDDYLDLLPGEETKIVAKAIQSVEAFVHAASSHLPVQSLPVGLTIDHSGSIVNGQSSISTDKGSILLHGHCHQKATYGTAGSRHALEQLGYVVKEAEAATCCGMAGAFGFEAEHDEISERIGELGVLPAARNASKETIIAAPGTSCRQQIEQFTGRKALHPIEIIRRAMNHDSRDNEKS